MAGTFGVNYNTERVSRACSTRFRVRHVHQCQAGALLDFLVDSRAETTLPTRRDQVGAREANSMKPLGYWTGNAETQLERPQGLEYGKSETLGPLKLV